MHDSIGFALRSPARFSLTIALFTLLGSFAHAEISDTRGSISNRYRFRTTGGTSDHELQTIGNFEFGEPMVDKYTVSTQIGGVFQLNGRQPGAPFGSTYDTFASPAVQRIYHGYLDINDSGPFRKFRFGRQYNYDFESLYFDGGWIETKAHKGLSLKAFGGVPVHMFENAWGSDNGDWLVGGEIQFDPVPAMRFRADVVRLRDKISGFRANVGEDDSTLMGLSFWWDMAQNFTISTRFTAFTDYARDVAFDTRLRLPDKNLSFFFKMYALLNTYGVRVIDYDAFSFAGAYEPYVDLLGTVTKNFGDHFAIDVGGGGRLMTKDQIASAFNHSYTRAFATFSTYDLPIKGLSLSATGDYYRGQDNGLKNNTFGGNFSATQEMLERKLKISGGTAFYLYKYNLYTGNESTNVQTFFVRASAKINKEWETRLGYEFETSKVDTFHTMDARVVWNF